MAEYAHPEFVAPYSAPVDEQEGEVILLGSAFSSSSSSKGRLGQALSEMQGTSPNTAFSQPAQQQKQKPVLLQQRGFLQQVPLKPQQQQQQQQSLPVQQQLTEDQQQQQPTPVPAQQAVPLPAQQQQHLSRHLSQPQQRHLPHQRWKKSLPWVRQPQCKHQCQGSCLLLRVTSHFQQQQR
jgi:hypothetical protein